jgi:hypothetical protein
MLGTVFGAMTPFCSCSTIPILAGLLNSKVPFGKGTLEFNRPASIGIVEQEQNGVIAPNTVPNI